MNQMSLLKSKRFFPLFLTQFFGAFNDNFLKNALVILITYKTKAVLGIPAAQMVAVAGGIFILPFFLFSAQAGQLADKHEKSRLIRWVKLAEIGIMALAFAGFVSHHYELLLAVLFLMGLHSTVFGPLKYSILPQHLAADELVGGNALVEAGTFLAILLGTIAGGVLIGIEPLGPIVVSFGLVLTAGVGYVASRAIPEAAPVDPSLRVRWNPIPPTWEILKSTRKTQSVFLSILGVSWFWFFGGVMLSLFPPYCKDFLHAEGKVVTLLLALFSVGIAIGSLFCERFSRHRLELGLVPLGSIGMTLFTLDLFFAGLPGFVLGQPEGAVTVARMLSEPQGLRILADLLCLSIFSGFYIVPLYTLIQTRSEVSHRSRIIAGNNILNALFMVVASLMLVAMMHFHLTIPEMFLTLALLNAAVAVYIYTILPEFLFRFLAWGLANVMYRMKVRQLGEIPAEGPVVLVCNHVSFVDWMIIAAGVQRPARFIMDHHFAKGWLAKRLARRAKIIPIAPAHESPEVLEAAFAKTAEELRAGEVVCIFPEGKITRDGRMNPFKAGVERILATTPAPVVPLAIVNMWGSFFSREGGRAIWKRPKRFWSRIELRIGEPIGPTQATAARLQEAVRELLGEENPERGMGGAGAGERMASPG